MIGEIFFSDTRGFMTSHGIPDESRSARYILKDYVKVCDSADDVHRQVVLPSSYTTQILCILLKEILY